MRDEPIAISNPTTAPRDEAVPVVVIICGGPHLEGEPADPYVDVIAGVRFPSEMNR